MDSFAVQGAFAKETGASFPLLSDWPQFNTGKAYDVLEEGRPVFKRVTYVIDKDGIVRGVVESETDMDIHAREALRIVKEELG
jgi:thioredoxin-dependent peroxiredoxin